jgi:hypothetical protein
MIEEHNGGGNQEEPETSPLARSKVLLFVESVEESHLYQVTGPHHGSRVNKVTTEDASHTKAQHLSAQDEEEVGQESKVLTVVDSLDDNDINSVGGSSSTVCSEGYQDVFLDVERARVERARRENVCHELSDGECEQFDDQG